jgi:hypothetical protein
MKSAYKNYRRCSLITRYDFFLCWCCVLTWIWCLWCYSECISTPGELEKYARPRWYVNQCMHMQYILKNAGINNINSEIFSIVLSNACVLIKLIYHIPGRIESISISESHLYFTDVKHSQHYTRKHNNEDHSAMYHRNSNHTTKISATAYVSAYKYFI